MSLFTVPKSDIDRLIKAIQTHPRLNDAGEIDHLFIEFQPMFRRLAAGETIEPQLKKLLCAGNPERAIKLLQACPRRRRLPLSKSARTMLGVAGIPVIILFLGSALPRCDATHSLVMEAVNQCPGATARLGTDIHQSIVGWSCGQSESNGGGWGHANWEIPVEGSSGSGRLQYSGEMHGGNWQLTHAILEVGEEHVSVYPCAK